MQSFTRAAPPAPRLQRATGRHESGSRAHAAARRWLTGPHVLVARVTRSMLTGEGSVFAAGVWRDGSTGPRIAPHATILAGDRPPRDQLGSPRSAGLLRLSCRPDQVQLAKAIRSTAVISSLAVLERAGRLADYKRLCPPPHERALSELVAGQWLPMELGLAHYSTAKTRGSSYTASRSRVSTSCATAGPACWRARWD